MVLEVSNTPWLYKRQYVLKNHPMLKKLNENENDLTDFYARFEKDFHVSPFLDVFYDYEWFLTKPDLQKGEIKARANSIRRENDVPKINLLSEDFKWKHVTGSQRVNFIKSERKSDEKIEMRVSYDLKKCESSLWTLLGGPFMTFMAAFWIHFEAYKVMIKKGADFQKTPENQRQVGFKDGLHNLLIFMVALLWMLINLIFIKPVKYLARFVKN